MGAEADHGGLAGLGQTAPHLHLRPVSFVVVDDADDVVVIVGFVVVVDEVIVVGFVVVDDVDDVDFLFASRPSLKKKEGNQI